MDVSLNVGPPGLSQEHFPALACRQKLGLLFKAKRLLGQSFFE